MSNEESIQQMYRTQHDLLTEVADLRKQLSAMSGVLQEVKECQKKFEQNLTKYGDEVKNCVTKVNDCRRVSLQNSGTVKGKKSFLFFYIPL